MEPNANGKNKVSFLRELTQRRVVQAALLYFAIAWTVTEVLSFLFDAIPVFPTWTKTVVALLFVLGFPVAMFLAWRFDVDPRGIHRADASSARGKLTIVSSLVLLLAATAGLFWLIYPQVQDQAQPSPSDEFTPPDNSIAVLPFINISDDPDNAFLGVGIPDTILHKIANLRDLIVIARTSSFAYGDGALDAATIGRQLNTRYLLEGSVQTFDNQARIIAQLIHTPDAAHVWSLDRRIAIDDIFEVQDEIAMEIARALRLTLRDDDRQRLLANGTDSVAAYLEFLRGNYAQISRSLELLDDALRHYDAALDIDPSFARAHVGIARTYHWLGVFGERDKDESRRLALEHIRQAIEIDDQLAPAYAALAEIQSTAGGRPDFELLQKAIELNPNDPEVMRIQAINICDGDPGDDCEQRVADLLREAIRRSPDNAELHFLLGFNQLMRGSIDAGVRSFNEALRHNPNMTAVYPRLARVLFAVKNDTPRSVSCLRDAIERDPRNFMPRIELASIFVDIGLDERAEQLLGEVADAPGIWGEFRKEILLNLHLYRGERQAALEIAKSISDKESLSPRDWIRHDLIFADALAKNELPELRDRLESLMSAAGTFDRDAPDVTSIGQNIPAPTLIKTYRALGEEHREETLVAAFERYIETHISGQPIQRGQIRAPVAELYLRRGDIDAALDELEPLPEQFRYNAWYVARDPDFAELQGHPRFVAITGRIDEFMRRDRQALLTAGDALPACVQR